MKYTPQSGTQEDGVDAQRQERASNPFQEATVSLAGGMALFIFYQHFTVAVVTGESQWVSCLP